MIQFAYHEIKLGCDERTRRRVNYPSQIVKLYSVYHSPSLLSRPLFLLILSPWHALFPPFSYSLSRSLSLYFFSLLFLLLTLFHCHPHSLSLFFSLSFSPPSLSGSPCLSVSGFFELMLLYYSIRNSLVVLNSGWIYSLNLRSQCDDEFSVFLSVFIPLSLSLSLFLCLSVIDSGYIHHD